MNQHITDSYILSPRHQLSVSVHGVGGTGSFLLSKLARLNVALQQIHGHPGLHVTAYDYDIIEEHNYVRSTFSPSDAGLPKASTIITRINRYYGLKWEGLDRKMTKDDQNTNIVFLCVDSLKSRKDIIKVITSHGGYHNSAHYYTFDVGNGDNYGQVILTAAKEEIYLKKSFKSLPMLKYAWELFSIKEEEDKPSCSMRESLNAQSLFINEFAAIITAEYFKEFILYPKITYNSIFFNLNDLSIKKGFIE